MSCKKKTSNGKLCQRFFMNLSCDEEDEHRRLFGEFVLGCEVDGVLDVKFNSYNLAARDGV